MLQFIHFLGFNSCRSTLLQPNYFLKCLSLSEELIEGKLDYCRQLLKLADVIEPGSSQLRDHLLFELQSVTEHKANRAFKRGSAEFKVITIHCGLL